MTHTNKFSCQTAMFILAIVGLVSCQKPETVPTVTVTATTAPAATAAPVSGSDYALAGCQSITSIPTPGAGEPSIFPALTTKDHTSGPEDAAVTILAYNDFQSSAGASLAKMLKQLQKEHPQALRLAYRHAPKADIYDKALLAAQSAEAAGEQDYFWQMHDLLFSRQLEWGKLPPEEFKTWVVAQAASLGLDKDQFASDLEREDIVRHAEEGWQFTQETGLLITPFILINGQLYNGPLEYESLDRIVRLIALGKRQFTDCPTMLINPAKEYTATLTTEKGEVVIMLFPDKAPLAVNNFVFLTRNRWFDNITWHRVLPDFVAQSGDPSGTGAGGPGYYFDNETDRALKFDRAGLVAMANSGPNTNGSQFFITLAPAPHLTGQFTIFGEVISGMSVLKALTPRDPQPGLYLPPGDALLSVTIEEH